MVIISTKVVKAEHIKKELIHFLCRGASYPKLPTAATVVKAEQNHKKTHRIL